MSRLVIRLVAAFLAFLFGLGAAQLIRLDRSRSVVHPSMIAPRIEHPANQAIGPTAGTGNDLQPPDSLAHTVTYLQQIRANYTDVPPVARPLLTRLKHQLRDLIADKIRTDGDKSASPDSLRRTLWDQLTTNGVAIEQPKDRVADEELTESSYSLGNVFDIEVKRPAGHQNLIAVTITLAIPCGSDASLYLFEKRDQQWELVLAQEANEYENISGAQGIFGYDISPADGKDNFFVVTVNVNPWCTSNWQAIRYSVLRVGATAYQPWVLAAGEETIYLGVSPPPYRLEVAKKWFSITFEGNTSNADIANGINSRQHVLKYSIQGEHAKRMSR